MPYAFYVSHEDMRSDQTTLRPAQANQRILDSAASRLGVPPERVVSNLAEYGNTSAASIPLALDEAVRAHTITPGNVVCLPPPIQSILSGISRKLATNLVSLAVVASVHVKAIPTACMPRHGWHVASFFTQGKSS